MGFFNSRYRSFKNALNGLIYFYRSKTNARIILAATVIALLVSVIIGLSSIEWLMVLLAIVLVNVSELINSSLEHTIDRLHPGHHQSIKHAKDLAAAATLLTSVFALTVGMIVFAPKLLSILT
jgi:diacylglycerol kinase